MGRRLGDYIALAAISDIIWDDADPFSFSNHSFGVRKPFQGDISQFSAYLQERCGFPVTEELALEAMRSLADCGLIRITDDNYSGTYLKVSKDKFDGFVSKADEEFDRARQEDDELAVTLRPSDYPSASAYERHPLFEDYRELGDDWLKRALSGIRKQYEDNGKLPSDETYFQRNESVPASDRIVTFTDNQISEIDKSTTQIIEAVDSLNQVDEQPGLRELLLGQLKAGRELVRAGNFRLFLIRATLIETLQFLAVRYEREAIGALAGSLLGALIKHIGIDS